MRILGYWINNSHILEKEVYFGRIFKLLVRISLRNRIHMQNRYNMSFGAETPVNYFSFARKKSRGNKNVMKLFHELKGWDLAPCPTVIIARSWYDRKSLDTVQYYKQLSGFSLFSGFSVFVFSQLSFSRESLWNRDGQMWRVLFCASVYNCGVVWTPVCITIYAVA